MRIFGVRKTLLKIVFSFLNYYLQRKLNRIVIKGIAERKLDTQCLGLNINASLFLNPFDKGFSKEFYLFGFREPLLTKVLSIIVKRLKTVVIDIGSNLGYYPLIELQSGAQYVIAIEPIPLTFTLLNRSLEKYKNKCKLLHAAISNQEGKVKLMIPSAWNQARILTKTTTNANMLVEVKALTLKSILSKFNFDKTLYLIRMDVEGYEYEILKDLPKQVNIIALELHVSPRSGLTKTLAIKLINNLSRQGYKMVTFIKPLPKPFYFIVRKFSLETARKLAEMFNIAVIIPVTTTTNVIEFIKKDKDADYYNTIYHLVFYKHTSNLER